MKTLGMGAALIVLYGGLVGCPREPASGKGHAVDRAKINRLVGESLRTLERGTLRLAAQRLSDEELAAVLADERVPMLVDLDVQSNPLSGAAIQTILGSPKLQGLRRLSLSDCAIGDEGLMALARAPLLRSVEFLLLAHVDATAKGVAALAASPYAGALRRLDLSGQPLGNPGASALLRLGGLAELTLQDVNLDGPGARALIEGTGGRVLDLGRNPLGPGSLVGLRRMAPSLRTLSLAMTGLGAEDVAALAGLPSALQALDLGYCPMGDDGVRALARAPWLGELKALVIVGSKASASAQEVLRQAYGARPGLTL